MWFFLLGLLGAAAGAGGGGGSSASAATANSGGVLSGADIPGNPPVDDDENIFDDLGDDDGEEPDRDDAPMGDDTMAGGDHMGDDTMADDDGHMGGGDHMGGDTMADDDDHMGGGDHMGDDTMAGGHDHNDDDGGHAGHGDHDHQHVTLPTTPEEIDAFVAAVRAAPETHVHDHGSSKAGEHMAAMDLVPRDEATHIAIAHGDWDDPANWHNGEVPGDDATVLVPEGVHMTYDHMSAARVLTVRVDGHLEFATDTDSQMIVDTLVVSPSGTLTIGTEETPVEADVNVDIIFANNGAIDTDWDPLLLSRGMISHGKVQIHGTEKDSHEKVVEDPMAGDTWVDMGSAPVGWAVGDTIVIAGTHYDGYFTLEDGVDYSPPEDEIRVITQIDGGMVYFDEPLVYDHDTPRDDLKTSVANYTRNVSFETENAEDAEIYERGHVMFMHNDDVDVRYAEFHELGRTDKSQDAVDAGDVINIDFDTNVKGRYSFHFHRAGMDDVDNPAISIGNSVYGSPGWGFVHHDSNAILENNATYDTFGAGYVAESGNEIGAWVDNIAIFAQGPSWTVPKGGNDIANFDLGRTGDGFWFQGRMVASVDNIAASVNTGFVYFHRGAVGENGGINFDAATSEAGDILYNDPSIAGDKHPILSFSGNETFASSKGMWVLKGSPNQSHDVHSVLEDFTAWNVNLGAGLEYTSHYTLDGFDIIGNEASSTTPQPDYGILFGGNVSDMTIVDATIENFSTGMWLHKAFTDPSLSSELHDYTVVDATFIDVETEYGSFDPALDNILSSGDLPYLTPDVALDAPLFYDTARQLVEMTGTKSDSLGETSFPAGTDTYIVRQDQVQQVLDENGYYATSAGQNYFMMDVFFSDRLTGDIYIEQHPVMLDQSPEDSGLWPDATFNGVVDLEGPDNPTMDSAELWAMLTDGQIVFSETDTAGLQDEEEPVLESAL